MKKMISLILTVIFAMVCTSCGNTSNPETSYSNKYNFTNLNNGGNVTADGTWIYYNNGRGIYKIKYDGTDRNYLELQSNKYGTYLNVHNGYLYCIGINEDYDEYSLLYRLNLETNDTEKLLDFCPDFVYVCDDWIYYMNYSSYSADSGIFRMKHDGSLKEHIDSSYWDYIYFDDSYIYVYDNAGSEGEIESFYRMNLDGTNKVLLCSDANFDTIPQFYDGEIFYTNNQNGLTNIYSIKFDGTEQQSIFSETETPEYYEAIDGSLLIYEDWLYYSYDIYYNKGDKDYSDTICRMTLDGSTIETLLEFDNYDWLDINQTFSNTYLFENFITIKDLSDDYFDSDENKFKVYDKDLNYLFTLE